MVSTVLGGCAYIESQTKLQNECERRKPLEQIIEEERVKSLGPSAKIKKIEPIEQKKAPGSVGHWELEGYHLLYGSERPTPQNETLMLFQGQAWEELVEEPLKKQALPSSSHRVPTVWERPFRLETNPLRMDDMDMQLQLDGRKARVEFKMPFDQSY